jgi:type IV pilus assembly protein PilX
MKQQPIIPSLRQQQGAVLIVSMLLLLVITILALGASQSTRLQERMAGSQRNYDLAFQAAEAGLRAGERMIDDNSMTAPPLPCAEVTAPACKVYERGYLAQSVSYEDQAFQPDEWWTTRGQAYSTSATPLIGGNAGEGLAKADPQFYIEELEDVPDSLSTPPTGPPPSRVYYRIVSRGKGGSDNAQVVLHSTYARRFN